MSSGPSIRSNTKYECQGCRAIQEIPDPYHPPACLSCGGREWGHLAIVAVCDFCSANINGRSWTYPCRSFRQPMPPGYVGPTAMSEGDWCACDVCHALIEAKKMRKLAKRAAKASLAITPAPVPLDEIVNAIAGSHRAFLNNVTGPPVEEDVTHAR